MSSTEPTGDGPAVVGATRLAGWRRALGIAGWALLAAAGLFVGIVGGFAQSWLAWLANFGTWGLLLAGAGSLGYLALLFAACWRGAGSVGGRLGALLAAVGWILGTLLVSSYAPGGDVVVTDSPVNYLLVYGGMLVVLAAAVSVGERRRGSLRPEGEGLLTKSEE